MEKGSQQTETEIALRHHIELLEAEKNALETKLGAKRYQLIDKLVDGIYGLLRGKKKVEQNIVWGGYN